MGEADDGQKIEIAGKRARGSMALAAPMILLADPWQAVPPDDVLPAGPRPYRFTVAYASVALGVLGVQRSAAKYDGRLGLFIDAELASAIELCQATWKTDPLTQEGEVMTDLGSGPDVACPGRSDDGWA
jgi:hypothetical protein